MSIKKDFLLQIKNYLIHNSDKCEDLVNSVNSPFYHIEHDNKELIEIINFIQSKELPNYICYATSSMGSIFHILYKKSFFSSVFSHRFLQAALCFISWLIAVSGL